MIKLSQNIGIVCFSATNDNILMWSHYADQHNGVVIGFESNLLSNDWIPVDYSKERYLYDFARDAKDVEVKKVIARKSDAWAYENEYRFGVSLQQCEKINSGNEPIFTFGYSSKAVKEVTIGCRMSDANINDFGAKLKNRYGNNIITYKTTADKIKYGLNLHKARF